MSSKSEDGTVAFAPELQGLVGALVAADGTLGLSQERFEAWREHMRAVIPSRRRECLIQMIVIVRRLKLAGALAAKAIGQVMALAVELTPANNAARAWDQQMPATATGWKKD